VWSATDRAVDWSPSYLPTRTRDTTANDDDDTDNDDALLVAAGLAPALRAEVAAYRRTQRHAHLVDHGLDNAHARAHVAALRAQVLCVERDCCGCWGMR
jgi:hypothetical protein